MTDQMNILIADDHALVRAGLKQVLEAHSNYKILEAEDGEEAIRIIREAKPAIAILDVEMPKMNGFEVAASVQRENISVAVIFLTMYKEEQVFNRAMDIGVKGYVLKENTTTEIIHCVQAIQEGRHYLSPSISDFMIRRNERHSSTSTDPTGIHLLTPTERKLLKLVVKLKTNQEIADELKISIKTVHNHRNNICDKLGLKGPHALVKFATENAKML